MAVKIFKLDTVRRSLATLLDKVGGQTELQVGFFEDATYPDGTPVAYIAAVQEFGGTVEVPEHKTEIYRSVRQDGTFNKKGRFVRRNKSNFATTHTVPAHVINIPPRPFMRNTIANNKDGWGEEMGKALKKSGYNAYNALNMVGEKITDQMKGEIKAFGEAGGNAPSTIRKKGFDTPLVDTGHMRDSVSYEVK